ncbi:tyrosine-type recombinase/integrase [Candidatus Latescibacterota bacterium]
MIVCTIQTGMRKSEILNLKWNNVDFQNNRITRSIHQ